MIPPELRAQPCSKGGGWLLAKTIPLLTGEAQQSFSVPLGDYSLQFNFFWVTRFGYFRVDIYDLSEGKEVVTLGQIAHDQVDMLEGFKYGKVYMDGDATPDNVGVTVFLRWEAPGG